MNTVAILLLYSLPSFAVAPTISHQLAFNIDIYCSKKYSTF